MDGQTELQGQFRQQQERYIYYLIALAVTSIGFSVYQTSGVPLRYSQLPLGVAVICWALSIYCGLRFIQYSMHGLFLNNAMIDFEQGVHPLAGTHPEKIQMGVEAMRKFFEQANVKGSRNFKLQRRFFYWGAVFFIVWHVYEMYLLAGHPTLI